MSKNTKKTKVSHSQIKTTAMILKHLIVDSTKDACLTFGISDPNERVKANGKVDMEFQNEVAEQLFQRAIDFIGLADKDEDEDEDEDKETKEE